MQKYTIQGTNNKAQNIIEGDINTLFSYDTEVAKYNTKTKEMKVFCYHSATTGRHINKFFELFGIPKHTKNELFKKYNLKN